MIYKNNNSDGWRIEDRGPRWAKRTAVRKLPGGKELRRREVSLLDNLCLVFVVVMFPVSLWLVDMALSGRL